VRLVTRGAVAAAAGVAVALAAAAGCGPRGVTVAARPPAPPRLVVVLPVELEHAHDAYDRWIATREVIRAVVAERRFDVLAPEEVSLLPDRVDPAKLHEETSLLVDAKREGYEAGEVVALRAIARRETEDTERLIVGLAPAGEGGADGRLLGRVRSMKRFAHVRVELWHPDTHVRLVAGERAFEENLLAERGPGEPSETSAAVAALVHASLKPLAAKLHGGRVPALPFAGVENPYPSGALAAAPESAAAGLPLDPGDALAAEARALERLRELDVRLGPADAKALAARGTGLLVLDAATPLEVRDFVTSVAGAASAAGPVGLAPIWRRWHALHAGEPLVLSVARGKEGVEAKVVRTK